MEQKKRKEMRKGENENEQDFNRPSNETAARGESANAENTIQKTGNPEFYLVTSGQWGCSSTGYTPCWPRGTIIGSIGPTDP